MRKILLIGYMLIIYVMTSFAQDDGYKIEGQLDKAVDGRLMLIAETEQGMVEIGDATITSGYFQFSGRMPEMTVVYLMPLQKNAILATIMLENARYMVTLGNDELVVESDGKAQKIWREFDDRNKKLKQNVQRLRADAGRAPNMNQARGIQLDILKMIKNAEGEELELLKKYRDSKVAAYVVALKMEGMDDTKLSERYEVLGDDVKSTIYGKRVATVLASVQKVAIGAIAPDFVAALSDGGMLSLYETNAKVKIVDFWTSQSVPCRREKVNYLKLYNRFRPKGLEIISVSLDQNKQLWVNAVGQDGCNWKNVSDLKGPTSPIAVDYCVKSLPCMFILDQDNRIVAKNLQGQELEKKIMEMLKKKK